MKVQDCSKVGVFYPCPQKDPYGLDSMYISPFQEQEIWNLSSFRSAEILNFSFLALRTVARELLCMQGLEIQGVGSDLKKSFLKKNWNLDTLPLFWKSVFPSIATQTSRKSLPISQTDGISIRLDWSDGQEEAGFGFLSNSKFFPLILGELVSYSGEKKKFYLRLSRQSFLYIPRIESGMKKNLFIQDKSKYEFPEFYYYWTSPIPLD